MPDIDGKTATAPARTQETTSPALAVDDVTAGYGTTTVLRNVSLSVPASSVVALLGANGAGKTTLLNVISGSVPTRAGRIMLGDENVATERIHRRTARGLCHISEGRAVFPSLTVKENLAMFCARGQVKRAIERATDAFPPLKRRLGQTAGTLSGGEQQMLALARAWLVDPRVVLVDEASMGLAPMVVDVVFDFLRRVAHAGTALLIVEQYVNRVLEIADKAYILNRGTITYDGSARRLLEGNIFERYVGST